MFAQTSSKKGFTLIELMVSVAVVAIISSIGYVSYTSAQVNARDARRKQDLRSISTALELFKQASSNKLYPVSTTGVSLCCGATASDLSSEATTWIPSLTNTYISAMPMDPRSNDGDPSTSGSYGYAYWSGPTGTGTGLTGGICTNASGGGGHYVLVTRLENTNDPDRNDLKNYKYCNNSTSVKDPSVAANKQLYVVTSQ